MNICFISDTLYNYLDLEVSSPAGGAQRQQYLLTQALQERGINVAAIVGDYGQPARTEYQGVKTYTGCPKNSTGSSNILRKLYKLSRAIRDVDADIYYIRGAPRLYMVALLATKIQRKPLVFCIANVSDVDSEYLTNRYGRRFAQIYLKSIAGANLVITQTEHQRQLLREHTGSESDIIPNGYPLPPQELVRAHTDREYVLWVGSTQPKKKRPEKYLQAACEQPEIPFLMIAKQAGDKEYQELLAARAKTIENLTYLTDIDPDAIHDYFSKAAFLVNTSRYEGFPNTYLEAWRYETPVVSLTHSLDGVLNDLDLGHVAGSEAMLHKTIGQLWDDLDKRQAMGVTARKYMTEHYSMDIAANLYKEALCSTFSADPASDTDPSSHPT